ncbi:hypothetical protein EVJ58_g8710 [Rhodofomes roseus]|uniref:Uncharacterized protein n=1 Tax=Rhodofomes roseus TaxID=34475 RepID=A0A4Y9XZX8_9APHY|nr:hypothetical protein EVJ58_g8710 [Rhodofomes roseus]
MVRARLDGGGLVAALHNGENVYIYWCAAVYIVVNLTSSCSPNDLWKGMDGDWSNVHLARSFLDELDGEIPDSLTNNASLLDWEHALSYSSYDPALEIVYASFDIDLPLLDAATSPVPDVTQPALHVAPDVAQHPAAFNVPHPAFQGPHPAFAPNPAFDTPHLAINVVQPGAFDVVQPARNPAQALARTPLNTTPLSPTLPQGHGIGLSPAVLATLPPDLGAHVSLASSTLSWTRDARQILNVLCPRCGKSICTGSKLQTNVKPLESHMRGRKCCPSSISEARIESAEARSLREQLFPPHSAQPQGLSVSARRATISESSLAPPPGLSSTVADIVSDYTPPLHALCTPEDFEDGNTTVRCYTSAEWAPT